MKALIIEEKDIKELFTRLELEKYKYKDQLRTQEEMHRWFNYVVRTWFSEQGL